MKSNSDWIRDEALKSIHPQKLEFLQQMLFDSKKYSGKQMLPFFMSLAAKCRSQNISFTKEEMDTIIPVLKRHASDEELGKMNYAISMFQKQNQ